MSRIDTTRRALAGAIVAAVAGGGLASPASSYLSRFAPLSGTVPQAARREVPGEVSTPYGPAELRYDDYHVPHVEGEAERAVYYAVGYAQAADRLFQMDLVRRSMQGRLSAVVGEATLDSDVFHRKMDFVGAAEATWEAVADTETGAAGEAFADGVNRYVEDGTLPLEFALLEFEPDPWSPVDTMLMQKQISWGLTGGFVDLQKQVVREHLDGALVEELYPRPMDHDSPIIRRGQTGGEEVVGSRDGPADPGPPPETDLGPGLVDWLSGFGSPPGVGSNSWVVSGEHTDSGEPIVCNDPHLSLMVPPVWYEQDLRVGDRRVRGVTFPGVPFVVIGENDAGAWGFTNVGSDVIDFYSYETDGDRYRYDGKWRAYDVRTETVRVAGGEDREVEARRTVHGPVLDREGQEVGVAWTGLAATRTARAIHGFARSDGLDDVLAALPMFDEPTQNMVYADRDGNTLYYVTGKHPDRRIDGEHVRGDRVFDGSAGEAEWEGFTPYGESTWEGFVPFEEKPHVVNPGYVGTANQRVVDDPGHYLGWAFAPPFRGGRIYDRLDSAVESGEPVDPSFVEDLQGDTYDGRAELLVPVVLDATDRMSTRAVEAAESLAGWDYRMDRESRAALVFARWFAFYRRKLFASAFVEAGLGESYWPTDWTVATLDADSPWFDHLGRERADLAAEAMDDAVAEIERLGHEVYGDYNVVDLAHPFQQEFLAYPALPMDGSSATVENFRVESDVGSSWRMVAPMADDQPSRGVIPGGNSGDYFSEHYHDQLRMWTEVEYKEMDPWPDGDPDVAFTGDGG